MLSSGVPGPQTCPHSTAASEPTRNACKVLAWRTQPLLAARTPPSSASGNSQHSSWRRLHMPVACCSSEGSTQPAAAATPGQNHCAVVEHLMLLQAADGVPQDSSEGMLDALWSLQYTVPGVLCAAAGPVTQSCSHGGCSEMPAAYTHLVHFRLASQQAHQQFTSHPLVTRTLAEAATPLCTSRAQISFPALLPKEMEALFKRGDALETGFLQLLLLGPGQTQPEQAPAFLSRLAQLAEATGARGVQVSHGDLLPVKQQSAESSKHALLVHFASQQDMQQFWASPACQALAACDVRLPVQLQLSLSAKISPSDDSNSTAF